jgi:peptide/nickel transport system ATP-binding protein
MVKLMSENLLEAQNLVKIFSSGLFKKRQITAVDNVSFSIPKATPVIMTIAGESGSGKTTIASIILRLTQPTKGRIVYNGKNIADMSSKETITYRKEIQMIFQNPYDTYNPFYRVDRVLQVPIRKFDLANSRSEEQKLVITALRKVGLKPDEVLGKYPHQLSGGERQRIMIARAFILKPKIVVADEPVSMVDASMRATILRDLCRMKKDVGISYIYITHDLSTAYTISDNIIILFRGCIVETGNARKVIENPKHPYLKTLIASVPRPEPDKRWRDRIEIRAKEKTYSLEEEGCKYFSRCPHRIDKCARIKPELIPIEHDHFVACHLHSI